MEDIAVIGSGTMGNGIAHVFAQSGYKVTLIDISQEQLDNALATIEKNLDRLVAKEKITAADKESTLGNISTHTDTHAAKDAVPLSPCCIFPVYRQLLKMKGSS